MNKLSAVWKLVSDSLIAHIPVMLLYVVESVGSSPGRQGFVMAVNSISDMQGSIGGGIMEHKFVEMAKNLLLNGNKETIVKKQIHDKEAVSNQSGMICSGEQTIVLYTLKENDLTVVDQIINCFQRFDEGYLHLASTGLSFSTVDVNTRNSFVFIEENDWIYTEQIGYKNHLHIIGAGHCALVFSKVMQMMDFYIHLYDDRVGLNTFLANHYVHEKKIVGHYNELEKLIPSGENCYVVVMTFGYRTDDIAVRCLLHKKFKYFGLLGSKSKIKKMFAEYEKEGVDKTILKSLHAPIGLDIKSETTEEIAISISAEIIKVKNVGNIKSKFRSG